MEIKFFLICISFAWLITSHRHFVKLHAMVFKKAYRWAANDSLEENYVIKNELFHMIYSLLTCPFCVGFWVAFFIGLIAFSDMSTIVVNAFISAIVCLVSCKLINRL